MYDKASILENGRTLESVPDCYKNQQKLLIIKLPSCNKICTWWLYMTQKMCDKAVNAHPSTIQFVPECYKTQEMCDKAVNRCFLYLILFLIGKILRKCVRRVVSEVPFLIIHCPNRHDEAIDDSLPTLKFIPDWFVPTKMIKKLLTAL